MTVKKLMSGEVVGANATYSKLQDESLASTKAFLQNFPLVVNGVFEMTMSG